jgi:hypothetical protein
MCWFEGGVSMSGGAPEAVAGIGLLPGSLTVHLDGESERLPVYRAAVASGELAPGYAADDGAAVLFAGTGLKECVASRFEARVMRVTPDGSGGVIEEPLPVRLLPEAEQRHGEDAHEPYGVSEMRALRAGRHRVDYVAFAPEWAELADESRGGGGRSPPGPSSVRVRREVRPRAGPRDRRQRRPERGSLLGARPDRDHGRT